MKSFISIVLIISAFIVNPMVKAEYKERKVTATVYHAVEAQTDSTPLITASGFNINPDKPYGQRIVALSRDLETKLNIKFGEYIYVDSDNCIYQGLWRFEDRMNIRYKDRIDFLVDVNVINKFDCKIVKVNL